MASIITNISVSDGDAIITTKSETMEDPNRLRRIIMDEIAVRALNVDQYY